MVPQARRSSFPTVVIERETDSEESSSEEEEDEGANEEDAESETENAKKDEEPMVDRTKGKAPISISLKKVCKVRLL